MNDFSKCPIISSLSILSKKWTIPVICELNKNTILRYNELQRHLKDISNVVLAQTLRNLESNGIVLRTQYNEIPPKVEYSLTPKGQAILPVLFAFSYDDFGWGEYNNDSLSDCPDTCNDNCHRIITDYIDIINTIDDIYLDASVYLRESKEGQNMHTVDKIHHILVAGLKHINKVGQSTMRKLSIIFLRNHFVSDVIAEPERPLFKILNQLIGEARTKNEIIDSMTNEQLINTWLGFIRGIDHNWQLSTDNYDLIDVNKDLFKWFFDNFKANR